MTSSPSGSSLDEARAFLEAHPEIEAFDIVLTDANGIGRGKIIRRHELPAFYANGRHLPISILGLDIVGEDVHETGLIWDSGDGDLRAWPLPGTLVPLHGTNPPRGQVLMSMYLLDGTPMTSDPRHALTRQVDAFTARGCGLPVPSNWSSFCLPTSAMPTVTSSLHAPSSTVAPAARPRFTRSIICTAWSPCFRTFTRPPKHRAFPPKP